MIAISSPSLFRRVRRVALAAATTTVLLLAAPLTAAPATAPKPPQHGVSEKTSEALVQLRTLEQAKDLAGMMKLLEGIPVKPGSYDEALILDMKARIFGMMEQAPKALEPWERALALSDQHGYFADRQTLEIVLLLAQLHLQESANTKDPARQQQHVNKALTYFRRFLEKTPTPSPEAMMTYAQILFHKAIADPTRIDQALLQEARAVVDQGLTAAVKPKEGFYQLLLALLQQQNDLVAASDLLELLLKQKPDKKDFWHVLVGFYLQLSEKSKDAQPWLARDYLVRAIVTFERAQGHGFLTGPKENLHLVSLYIAGNQFTKATELLHDGLKKGTIESEPLNWRLLARYYQDTNLHDRSIAILQEAIGLFPKNGEMELQLAQLYMQLEKYPTALGHAQAAAAKGNFETTKPFAVHHLIAFLAYDLGRLEDAQAAVAAAEQFPDEVAKDAQFPKLKAVIVDALNERKVKAEEEQKKKDAAAPKKTALLRKVERDLRARSSR